MYFSLRQAENMLAPRARPAGRKNSAIRTPFSAGVVASPYTFAADFTDGSSISGTSKASTKLHPTAVFSDHDCVGLRLLRR